MQDARNGRGPIGSFLDRTNALQYVQQHQTQIRSFASGLTTPAAGVLKGIATGVAGTLTIFVLSYLMVLEGPRVVDGTLALLDRLARSNRAVWEHFSLDANLARVSALRAALDAGCSQEQVASALGVHVSEVDAVAWSGAPALIS